MNQEAFLQRIQQLSTWKAHGTRAPHKPLLLMLALGRIERGEDRLVSYRDVWQPLSNLLVEFGPTRKVSHPEYPFWRLERDGVWDVQWPDELKVRESRTVDPSHQQLLEIGLEAGFTGEVDQLLRGDPKLRHRTAEILLHEHFPATLHDEIRTAVGLGQEWETVKRRARDPAFSGKVLAAWGHRCGVCSYDVRVGEALVGLDAAHIRWKQAGGPDAVENGLALCAVHHRLFDRGAFTIRRDSEAHQGIVLVSGLASGAVSFRDWLGRYHHQPLDRPPAAEVGPRVEFLRWHQREVFKSPSAPS